MATHSSVLAWRIPGMAEPGGLLSMESHRVRHDWSDLAAAAAAYLEILCRLFKLFFLILFPFLSFSCYLSIPMAPYSSTLAWKIPWTEKTVGLQSMGSLGVGYDWAASLSLFTFMHWRRKWQPTPVFLPGESQGRQSLVGSHLWGRTESDTTEVT